MLTEKEIIRRLKKEAVAKAPAGIVETSNGLYTLGKCLGAGNQGKVYQAKYFYMKGEILNTVDSVVIKETVGVDAVRIQSEHDCLKKIYPDGHHDLLSNGEHTYLVMPYIEGQSLASFIDEKHALSLGKRLQILMNFFKALRCCHKAGIVHLDLKALNVLFNEKTNQVHIIDFGYARRVGEKIKFSSIKEALYDLEIPPECLNGTLTATSLDCYAITLCVAEILGMDKVALIQDRVKRAMATFPDPLHFKEDVLAAVKAKKSLGDAFYHPRLLTKWSSPITKNFLTAYVQTPYDFSVYSDVLNHQLITLLNGLQCPSIDERLDMEQCLTILNTFLKAPEGIKSSSEVYSTLEAREDSSVASLVSNFSRIISKSERARPMPLSDMCVIEEEEEDEEEADLLEP